MANNCLVKKLKGTVNNTDLEYFGMLKMHFDEGTTVTSDTDRSQVVVRFSENTTVTMVNAMGGCHFTNDVGTADYGTAITFTANTNTSFFVSKGTCDVIIPKATLEGINISTTFKCADRVVFNIDGLSYYPNFKFLIGGNAVSKGVKSITGDINSLSGDSITTLTVPRSSITGDINSFLIRNHSTLETVSLFSTSVNELDLSILDQYSFHNLTSFYLPSKIINANIEYLGNVNCKIGYTAPAVSEKFYGTMESYAIKRASLYGAGSATMENPRQYKNVTYNNTTLYNVFPNGTNSATITWDESGNITSFE
jgi:hypothetical protein